MKTTKRVLMALTALLCLSLIGCGPFRQTVDTVVSRQAPDRIEAPLHSKPVLRRYYPLATVDPVHHTVIYRKDASVPLHPAETHRNAQGGVDFENIDQK